MIDIAEIASTISSIQKNQNVLSILLEIEGIFEKLHLYAYENWIKGEIIRGPEISKYWVEIYLMYPKKLMPNPTGALRLTKHGCYVFFQKDTISDNVKIKSQNDLVSSKERPGKMQAKVSTTDVYIVKVVIPRHLIDDQNLRKTANQAEIDYDDVLDAYDQGLDVSKNEDEDEEDTTGDADGKISQ
jgi:hypothetical protein